MQVWTNVAQRSKNAHWYKAIKKSKAHRQIVTIFLKGQLQPTGISVLEKLTNMLVECFPMDNPQRKE